MQGRRPRALGGMRGLTHCIVLLTLAASIANERGTCAFASPSLERKKASVKTSFCDISYVNELGMRKYGLILCTESLERNGHNHQESQIRSPIWPVKPIVQVHHLPGVIYSADQLHQSFH